MAAELPGVGHGDHQVGLHRRFGGQLLPHPAARRVEGLALHHRVGAGEVDELEDAERLALAVHHLLDVIAVLVDPADLPRLDLADQLGADDVQARRLAGQAVAVLDLAQHQRTDAVGIAEADDLVLGEQHGAEGAAQLGDDVAQRLPDVARGVLGQQGGDDLGVGRALEDVAVLAPDRRAGRRC